MIWGVLVAVLVFTIVVAVGTFGRALIIAWTRAPRHAREAAIDAEARAHVSALRGELREVPEPGKDYISDQNVRLPWTPQAGDLSPFTPGPVIWTPKPPPTEAQLAEYKERFLAAVARHDPPRVLPPDPVVTVPTPDVDADVAEWQHILAPAERLATDTDIRDVLPDWVIEALGGHDGVDAAVESIVARAVTT